MTIALLSGTARWAKVRKAVLAYDEKYNEFTIDLIPTDEAWKEFKASGLQLKARVYDDGERYITFRRKEEEMNYAKNTIQTNGPPKVYLKDTQSDQYNVWPEGAIGNGSKVTLSVEVYKTRNGMGHRLSRVWVDELVPFEGTSETAAPDTAALPF